MRNFRMTVPIWTYHFFIIKLKNSRKKYDYKNLVGTLITSKTKSRL